MGEKDRDPFLSETSNEKEPHEAEFVPHQVSAERRETVNYDPAGNDPGEEDPEMSDTLDEALANVLPDDNAMQAVDVPVADFVDEESGFPLVDRDPGDLPDDETGDVDDEERLEQEAEADDPVIFGRVRK